MIEKDMTKQASSHSIPESRSTSLEYQPASETPEQHFFLPSQALCVCVCTQLKHPCGPEQLWCNTQAREMLIIPS